MPAPRPTTAASAPRHRAALLAKATGQSVTPFAIGAQEELGLNRHDVQIILIPEPTDD